MAELKFSTGDVSFTVNDGAEISYNPTDMAFVERLFDAFDALDKKQEEYKRKVDSAAGTREIFAVGRELDAEMRALIDGVFGGGVCDGVFGGMNTYAMADGLPVWCNFVFAVMDTVDTTFAREQKATNPRLEKYMKKYHR